MNKPHPDEVPGLTGLRVFAAFSVVIAHCAAVLMHGHELPSSLACWSTQASGFGMILFFVLSGFVIHYSYANLVTEGRLRGISVYLWVRFARLWQLRAHWMSPLRRESANAVRFFAGSYSLAETYSSHANSPLSAINPGALAAARQVPYADLEHQCSYCVMPGT